MAQVESFSMLAALLPCHQLRDFTRLMVTREAVPTPLLPWRHLPKFQLGIPALAFPLSGPPCTLQATSSSLNHIVVSFFAV